jgi:rhomboid family protein
MIIPFSDHNPLKYIAFQRVTVSLIIINTLVFVFFQSGYFQTYNQQVVLAFAIIPKDILVGTNVYTNVVSWPEGFTLFTYMFFHGGWLHLIANMIFLWVFGDNIEDAMGHSRFLVFYLCSGIAAGMIYSLASPGSNTPLIGASGAIAGVTGAYLMLYPRVKIWVLLFMRIPLRLPAVWVLGAWLALQVYNAATDGTSNVAWWAHIGGFAAGAALIILFKRPSVPLFGAAPPPA